MDINMNNVGQRIKHRRKELILTQTDIYRRCGIASGALSQIENGTRTPSVVIFYKLSQILECNMEWLLTGLSTNSDTLLFSENEYSLIQGYKELSECDKNELIEILQMKLRKPQNQRHTAPKSSISANTKNDSMVG